MEMFVAHLSTSAVSSVDFREASQYVVSKELPSVADKSGDAVVGSNTLLQNS
jgi:hypothetical protein